MTGLMEQPFKTPCTCSLLKLDRPMERTNPSSTHFSIAFQVSAWSTTMHLYWSFSSLGKISPPSCRY